MFFDALTIAAARDEMVETLVPGRVQQVRAVGPLAIALEIYGNHRRRHLLLSAHAQYARAHLLAGPPTRDPGVRSPFLLLLRKYIRGAVLQSIEQPDLERVLHLTFTKVLRVGDSHTPDDDEADDADYEASDDPRADIPPGFALFETRILAEIMGRHSNIVLVGGDGIILDAIKRIPPSINRVRTTLPHMPYVAPPAQRKVNLLRMGERSFSNEILDLDPNAVLSQALIARFRSVSPLLTSEAIFRANLEPKARVRDTDPASLYRELSALLSLAESAEWDPSLAWAGADESSPRRHGDTEESKETTAEPSSPSPQRGEGGGEGKTDAAANPTLEDEAEDEAPSRKPLAFAPYPLRHLEAKGATLQSTVSISRAAELFYLALEQVSGHAQLKADVQGELRERVERLDRRIRALRGEMDRAAGFEALRHKAELLMAYMYVVELGQRSITIPEEDLTITLDPDRTPLEQAQAMFREYQRARAAVAGVPARIEASELGLRYLEELASALDVSSDFDTIGMIRADLLAMPDDPDKLTTWQTESQRAEAGKDNKKGQHGKANAPAKGRKPKAEGKKPSATAHPVQVKSRDGVTMIYGRSARENDALTFGVARPGDLWLHARGVPGSHVIVRSEGRAVPESTVAEAARLAARNSKARNEGAVDVIVTERRHVRRIPGAPPGLVTYSEERVLRVRVDEKDGNNG